LIQPKQHQRAGSSFAPSEEQTQIGNTTKMLATTAELLQEHLLMEQQSCSRKKIEQQSDKKILFSAKTFDVYKSTG
jgi:hypothetical protein